MAESIPVTLTDFRCGFPLRHWARHVHLGYEIIPRTCHREHKQVSINRDYFGFFCVCTGTLWTKCMCNVYFMEQESLPAFQRVFFSLKCIILEMECWKAMDVFSSIVFFSCSSWQAGQCRYLQTKQLSFPSALGQPQWLPWHGHIIGRDVWKMFCHKYYKCVVAKRHVNEVALPTTGKPWQARLAVLRTQWEILLGGIQSAKRYPPAEICLDKIPVLLTLAPRRCRCKREKRYLQR